MLDWSKEWIAGGFPWCDTCGEACVFSEFDGWRHTTEAHPWGVPSHVVRSDHAISIHEWSGVRYGEVSR